MNLTTSQKMLTQPSLFEERAIQPKNTVNFNNKITLGNCFDLIKEIKDDSIDLIATDPPYQINFENNLWDIKNSLDWKILAIEFNRILKKNGNLIVFQGWSEVVKTINCLDNFFQLKNWIIYDRIKGRGAKTNLVSTREDILWYIKGNEYIYNKISSTILKKTGGTIGKKNGNKFRALSNVWTDISPIVPWSKERISHPTQKPLAIMERIVSIFSNKNQVILDPFMGSGTTCLACKNLDRKYIGFELDEKYFEIAQKKLNEN